MTERALSSQQALKLPTLELRVVEGPDRGRRVRISGTTRVGSAPGNELHLTDRAVSRLHATITLNANGVRIRDASSTNGTVVDGVRVRDADVSPASLIHIGATVLRVEETGEPEPVQLSSKTKLGGLVGASAGMRQVFWAIERAAPTDGAVLVQGETGTGKELVARTIHALSERASKRFVAIDCGAVPENLIESELFGQLSGAVANRIGVIEEADGGTLFLDEIGELSLPLQRKLLRALETREILPLGANHGKPVDVRVVAATNRPLGPALNEGLFREDLYYRLAAITLEIPPLRARRADIPMLAQHFLVRNSCGNTPLALDLIGALTRRAWPGNVRELRNYIERHVALTAERNEPASDLPSAAIEMLIDTELPYPDARDAWALRFDALYVRALLEKTGGNVSRAAARAGISRCFLQRQMMLLGLREPSREGDEDRESDPQSE